MASITGTVTLNIEVRINGFLIEGQKAAELAYKLLELVPEGEGTGDEVSVPEKASEPQYRYFHDDDELGLRYWRRVIRGEDESTKELFKEHQSERGWQYRGYVTRLSELEANWAEVTFWGLPLEAR